MLLIPNTLENQNIHFPHEFSQHVWPNKEAKSPDYFNKIYADMVMENQWLDIDARTIRQYSEKYLNEAFGDVWRDWIRPDGIITVRGY